MTHKTQPTAHAEITAPISADLRGIDQPAAPDFDLSTVAGGRGYVAWYFANVMKRYDFTRYINDRLAVDFACALASHLKAAPPAPAAVTDVRDAEIAGLTASVGHLSALVDGQQEALLRAKAAMTALHNSASPIDESRGDLDARIPEADFRQFVDEHAALIHAIAQSPVAAAPAQEHATQLAGQGGTADAHAAWSAFEKLESDRGAAEPQSNLVRDYLMRAARVGIYRAAAPAQAQEDAPDPVRALIATHAEMLEDNAYAYFELAYTRQTGWMAWITDKPLYGAPVVNPDRKVLANGQGDTPDEACADAARAAQGGAA